MKIGLSLAFVLSVVITSLTYHFRLGCGTFVSLIFEVLSWKIVASFSGAIFSDTHPYLISILAAGLSSACLTLLLWITLAFARTRGYFSSSSGLAKALLIGTVLYLLLLLVALPMEKCM